MEIDFCFFPFALHRALRQATHGCNLGEGESAEELEIDELRKLGIHRRELIERFADPGEFASIGDFGYVLVFECSNFDMTTAFLSLPVARMIDDEAAHYSGRISHKTGAIGEPRF